MTARGELDVVLDWLDPSVTSRWRVRQALALGLALAAAFIAALVMLLLQASAAEAAPALPRPPSVAVPPVSAPAITPPPVVSHAPRTIATPVRSTTKRVTSAFPATPALHLPVATPPIPSPPVSLPSLPAVVSSSSPVPDLAGPDLPLASVPAPPSELPPADLVAPPAPAVGSSLLSPPTARSIIPTTSAVDAAPVPITGEVSTADAGRPAGHPDPTPDPAGGLVSLPNLPTSTTGLWLACLAGAALVAARRPLLGLLRTAASSPLSLAARVPLLPG